MLSAPKVLVVDDEPEMADICVEVAELAGCEAAAVHSAEAFRASAVDTFSLLILDLSVPGMNGSKVLRELGERGSPVRVIIVSGMDQTTLESTATLARNRGADVRGVMSKPVRIAQLKALIEAALA